MIKKIFSFLLNIFITFELVLSQTHYFFDTINTNEMQNAKINQAFVNYGNNIIPYKSIYFGVNNEASTIKDKINGVMYEPITPKV